MKLASIETIKAVKPHPNADRLDLVTINGWQAVVKKGDFKEGDNVVYIATDSIVPKTSWSEFLASKSKPDAIIRIRSIKLRGEYSSGLVLPVSVLGMETEWHEGADVGNILGVKKYEKEMPAQLIGKVKGSFPTHIAARTDEDNGLSHLKLVDYVLSLGHTHVTLKLDGSSCTIVIRDGAIENVCSRNIDLEESEGNAFWQAARKLTIPAGFTGVVQGELMGPGIQGNQLELTEPTLYVFQIKVGDLYLQPADLDRVCRKLNVFTVPTVLHWSQTDCSEEILLPVLQDIADQVDLREFFPHLPLETVIPAEGIVVRPATAVTSGSGRPLGFKLINRNYGE